MANAMSAEITFDRGRAVQSNFHDFPLVYHSQAPAEVEVDLTKSDFADGPRRAGAAARRARHLQGDLRGDGQAHAVAAAPKHGFSWA